MWFRNLIIYRYPLGSIAAGELEAALEGRPLMPCGGFDMVSRGWVAAAHDERPLYTAHGQHLIALGTNQKLLPAAIIKQVAHDRAIELENERGYPVSRRQLRELKQQVTEELRGRALTRRRITRAWIDPSRGWLCIDAPGVARAEEVVETLRETLGSFAATRLDTERSTASAMTAWLKLGDAPGRFTLGEELELKAVDQGKATVRYAHHPLDGKDIRAHLTSGKGATRLGLTWNDRLAFLLTDKFELKRLEFLGVDRGAGSDSGEDAAERFETDFVLMSGEFAQMLADLVDVLGGERQPGDIAAVEVAA